VFRVDTFPGFRVDQAGRRSLTKFERELVTSPSIRAGGVADPGHLMPHARQARLAWISSYRQGRLVKASSVFRVDTFPGFRVDQAGRRSLTKFERELVTSPSIRAGGVADPGHLMPHARQARLAWISSYRRAPSQERSPSCGDPGWPAGASTADHGDNVSFARGCGRGQLGSAFNRAPVGISPCSK
jgi:hypothetical protein